MSAILVMLHFIRTGTELFKQLIHTALPLSHRGTEYQNNSQNIYITNCYCFSRLRRSHSSLIFVGNSSSQPYPASGLAGVFPTLVVHSCYYSLVKPIQSFLPHISTILPKSCDDRAVVTLDLIISGEIGVHLGRTRQQQSAPGSLEARLVFFDRVIARLQLHCYYCNREKITNFN